MNSYDNDGLLITDRHVFFFKNKCPFSNFYQPCQFLYTYKENTDDGYLEDTHRMFSSEQAFMWHKAMFFKDRETARKILFEGKESPKFCKEQGRLVKNYDDGKWNSIRSLIMLRANYAKFSQSKDLKKFILDKRFDGKTFVEASPYDRIWGIGLGIEDKEIDDESSWRGTNLQGKVIGNVRSMLLNR